MDSSINFHSRQEGPASAPRRLCIVSGLSGAGKSTALRAFEDLGFFVVDGLPAPLLSEMAALMQNPDMGHFHGMAAGMDLRQANFMNELNKALLSFSSHGMEVSLIFLEASDEELFKRYAATRRPHPLEKHCVSLAKAIEKEKKELDPLRDMADYVLETTGFSIHNLRDAIKRHVLATNANVKKLQITVLSFGFRFGLPTDADFVFDLRFLPNPYFEPKLKSLSGLDKSVADYVFTTPAAAAYLQKILDLLKLALKEMETEDRSRITIALGCTGGRHRSVAFAEKLAESLSLLHYPVMLEHRALDNRRALEAVS